PVRFDDRRKNAVTDPKSRADLIPEELNEQDGEKLPERQALSLIDANVAAPVNAAAALNVLSDDSTAVANAEQSADNPPEHRLLGGTMARKKEPEKLTEEEIAEANAGELPERAAMSVIRGPGLEPLPQPIVPIDPSPHEPVPDA